MSIKACAALMSLIFVAMDLVPPCGDILAVDLTISGPESGDIVNTIVESV
jgi:hypothetical protein